MQNDTRALRKGTCWRLRRLNQLESRMLLVHNREEKTKSQVFTTRKCGIEEIHIGDVMMDIGHPVIVLHKISKASDRYRNRNLLLPGLFPVGHGLFVHGAQKRSDDGR